MGIFGKKKKGTPTLLAASASATTGESSPDTNDNNSNSNSNSNHYRTNNFNDLFAPGTSTCNYEPPLPSSSNSNSNDDNGNDNDNDNANGTMSFTNKRRDGIAESNGSGDGSGGGIGGNGVDSVGTRTGGAHGTGNGGEGIVQTSDHTNYGGGGAGSAGSSNNTGVQDVAFGATNYACLEVGYVKERFANNTKKPMNMLSAVSYRAKTFSHRVKSFRHDVRSRSQSRCFDQQNQNYDQSANATATETTAPTTTPAITLLEEGFNEEGDETIMTVSSGEGEETNSLDDSLTLEGHHHPRRGRSTNSTINNSNNHYRTNTNFNEWIISPTMEESGSSVHTNNNVSHYDIDRMNCNEQARQQYKIWKRAAIEGPTYIRRTALVATCLIVLLLVLLITVGYFPRTPSSIITCFYFVVGASLILLFETRSGIWLPYGRYLRENNDDGVLPMDVYREYGENHPDVMGAQAREDVVQKLNVLRLLYGRAGLYAFTGSMTLAMLMIPTSSHSFSNIVTTMIYGLGLVLMVLGAIAFIVGVHAAFRWTLLDTSIHYNSEHLREKFIAASSTPPHNDDDAAAAAGRNQNMQLDQFEFSLLVMTLGVDMEENSEIPLLFGQFAKNPDCITFTEFHSWWRGRGGRGSVRRNLHEILP